MAPDNGGFVAAATTLSGLRATGPVVQVEPRVFSSLLTRQPNGLVVVAVGGALRPHKYLFSYRGLLFTTSSRTQLELPRAMEAIQVKRLHLPY
jgi:hypothetical protein